jgi:site-specific DNA-cytosine methylase
MPKKYTFIDLFCGYGGMSLSFEKAKYNNFASSVGGNISALYRAKRKDPDIFPVSNKPKYVRLVTQINMESFYRSAAVKDYRELKIPNSVWNFC